MEENRYLKKFGQNFLNNTYIAEEIVKRIDKENINVLEIGPGAGSLTQFLYVKNINITCVEIDEFYVKKLSEMFANLKIVNENVLKHDFSSYDLIIGNIPYNITSELLIKIIKGANKLYKLIFMTQKEAYERIIECKNKSEKTPLSLLIQTKFDYKKILNVSKDNFTPKPNVDSTVFELTLKKEQFEIDYSSYYNFLLTCFNSKRKKLYNNLAKKYDKDTILLVLSKNGINIDLRPEDLNYIDYVKLFKELEK